MESRKNSSSISLGTQYWLFKKQPVHIVLLIIFLIAGLYGLYQGFSFKSKQINTINAFREEKVKELDELKTGLLADTSSKEGAAAYKKATGIISSNWNINLPAFKTPVSTAIFNIGQADVFPYYYNIKNESFFMQLFKQGEIVNPLRSLAGHFDTSFWIIYLIPLLLIVLCFNTLPAELDNGNWKLISSQGVNARQWVLSKFLLVSLLIEGIVLFIFIVGILLNYWYFNQSPSVTDFLFLLAANLYLAFWLVLIYAINVFGKTSSNTALYCGIAWITICFIIPSLVTTGIEKIVPVDNTIISRMSRRPQGSKFDDKAFGVRTIKQMGVIRPVYKNAVPNPESPAFRFGVYMAYHELMDDTNKVAVQKYFKNIQWRQQLTNASSLFNPAAGIDGLFAHLSANDAMANHAFIWQTKAFHAKLHDAYFPSIFFNRLLTKDDYDKFPVFKYQPISISGRMMISYFFLLVITVYIFIMSDRNLKNKW
jgi:ABC-2 type transport system permease protein